MFSLGMTDQALLAKLSANPGMLRKIVTAQEGSCFDQAHFKEIGNSTLLFEIANSLADPDFSLYMETQQAINLELMRRFDTEGIAFACPGRPCSWRVTVSLRLPPLPR